MVFMATTREVAEQAYAAMQAGDIRKLTSLCAADCVLNDIGITLHGPEEIGQYLQAFFTAFPDITVEVRRLIVDGNSVAAEVRFAGTQTGPLPMPTGELPASGRRLDIEAADLITIENGQIATWRVYLDTMLFMTQLGLIPSPAAAATAN
jgi:steroid delta-isomerase-like uncharacterized protein